MLPHKKRGWSSVQKKGRWYICKFLNTFFHKKFLILIILFLLSAINVFAEHEATVTISPNVANCNQLGNTFTVTVENENVSADKIIEVALKNPIIGELLNTPANDINSPIQFNDNGTAILNVVVTKNNADKIGA